MFPLQQVQTLAEVERRVQLGQARKLKEHLHSHN